MLTAYVGDRNFKVERLEFQMCIMSHIAVAKHQKTAKGVPLQEVKGYAKLRSCILFFGPVWMLNRSCHIPHAATSRACNRLSKLWPL